MRSIIDVLRLNAYMPMKTNLENVVMFFKDIEDKMNIVAVVNNTTSVYLGSEQLRDIEFQVERKFLLKGRRYVNIQYIIITDDIERDKNIGESDEISFWLYDIKTPAIIAYENSLEEFETLREQMEGKILEASLDESKDIYPKILSKSLVNTCLIIINIIAFVSMDIYRTKFGGGYFIEYGASQWKSIFYEGEYYRLITSMFIHFDIGHLFGNTISLMAIGAEAERMYGKIWYLFIYMFSGIGAGVISCLYYMNKGEIVYSAGASGAIFGVIGAVLVGLYLERKLDRASVIGRMIILFAAACFGQNCGVDTAAHIGGFVTGMLVATVISYIKYLEDKAS